MDEQWNANCKVSKSQCSGLNCSVDARQVTVTDVPQVCSWITLQAKRYQSLVFLQQSDSEEIAVAEFCFPG